VRIGRYTGILRRMVRLAKFGGRDHLNEVAARMLAARLSTAPWFADVDALVAVPTHWTHRIEGGAHLAGALTRLIAGRTRLPAAPLLRRTRGGPHQYEIRLAERDANVRGVFAVRRGARVGGARLCVIDDISTSGATLAEVRRVLRKAGAAKVYAAIVAKGGSFTPR
jgi:predicted amidophosphoribosyltransferase